MFQKILPEPVGRVTEISTRQVMNDYEVVEIVLNGQHLLLHFEQGSLLMTATVETSGGPVPVAEDAVLTTRSMWERQGKGSPLRIPILGQTGPTRIID